MNSPAIVPLHDAFKTTHVRNICLIIFSGWLDKFKTRCGIVSRLIKGESASVNMQEVQEWKEDEMAQILEKYEDRDIINADETSLFWKCVPSRTLIFKGQKPEGRKAPKDRLSILVACSMDGSLKLPLLIIGKQ